MPGTKSLCSLLFVPIIALGILTGPAHAGRIDPGLDALMQAAGPEEFIQVVIRPVGTLVGANLKQQVTTRYATRAEQHTAAVQALRATAEATQPAILNALGSDYFDGRVLNAQGFWIDNVITAHMTPSAIAELAQRSDIDEILAMPKVELVAPIPADATGVEDQLVTSNHIKAIRADSVWSMGYTGTGRLVASLDTGVDGKHLALTTKWRGHNGYSIKESWFDPIWNDTVPQTYPGTGNSHGTQVMGIMVSTAGLVDTIGVCPDCQWISAGAIDIPCPSNPLLITCGNLFESLQWVADPDGDPLTSHDVPDAVANPWGAVTRLSGAGCVASGVGCDDVFWNAIDNIEAAGAVMIFAAGNEGDCGAGSIRNPANRISSETNAFSVGMVDTRTEIDNPLVDGLSSRGPSDCDGATVKPELVAPGVNIRTTTPPVGFTTQAYGTSFSTPYVAGAVALLREYNPNATVDQIKQALLTGARDLGTAGPDNLYGHGILNVIGALRALPANTKPNIGIRKNYYVRPAPGQSTQIVLNLKNSGTAATGVTAAIVSNDPRLSVQDGTATFADMPNVGDTAANHDDPFDVTVSAANILSGERIPITVTITAADGYTRTIQAAILTGPERDREMFTHNAGNFEMTISSFGGFGLQIDNLNPRKGQDGYGVGFLYGGDPTPSLFEGAFLVGIDGEHVSDVARNTSGAPDVDFMTDPGGRLTILEPGEAFPEETRAGFSDAYAENPIGLFIEQRTSVSSAADEDDYLVCEYTIWNRSSTTVNGLRAGLYFDWDFPWFGTQQEPTASRDVGGYIAQHGVGWMTDSEFPLYRGIAAINLEGTSSCRYFDNFSEVYDGLTEGEKWDGMSGGFEQVNPPAPGDGSQLVATGPFTIAPGASAKVAFVIIGGTSQAELVASVQAARQRYNAGLVFSSAPVLEFHFEQDGPDSLTQTTAIVNATDNTVSLELAQSPEFGTAQLTSLSLSPGESTDLTLRLGGSDLPPGTYADHVIVETSEPQSPEVQVATTLKVSGSVASGSVNPNPFDPTSAGARVSMALRKAANDGTTARIYDLGGRLVRDFGRLSQGATAVLWDGRTDDDVIVASGVYICYVESPGTGGFKQTFKVAVKKS